MPNHTLRKYGNNYFKTLIIIINTNSVPPRIFPGLSVDSTVNIQREKFKVISYPASLLPLNSGQETSDPGKIQFEVWKYWISFT